MCFVNLCKIIIISHHSIVLFPNQKSYKQEKTAHTFLLCVGRIFFYRFPLIYGWPDAFGAVAFPIKPASARIVNT